MPVSVERRKHKEKNRKNTYIFETVTNKNLSLNPLIPSIGKQPERVSRRIFFLIGKLVMQCAQPKTLFWNFKKTFRIVISINTLDGACRHTPEKYCARAAAHAVPLPRLYVHGIQNFGLQFLGKD